MEHSNDKFLVIREDCGDYHYYPQKSANSVKFLYKLFNSFEMLNKIGFTICETIKDEHLTIKNTPVSIVADFSVSRPMCSDNDYHTPITENGEEEPMPDMLAIPLRWIDGFDIDESKSTKDHLVMDLDEPLDVLMDILDDVFPTEFKEVELSKYIIKDKDGDKPEHSIYTLDIQNMLDEDDETGLIIPRLDMTDYINKTMARLFAHRYITIDYVLA